jgi:hypothetical protein
MMYFFNNPINDKDPTGKLGIGLGGFVGETLAGLQAYYTGLDMALQASDGSWEGILDATINMNSYREFYFNDMERYGMPFEMMLDVGKIMSYFYNTCNWEGLYGCIRPTLVKAGKWHGTGIVSCFLCGLMSEVPGVGIAACGVCEAMGIVNGMNWLNMIREAKQLKKLSTCVYNNCISIH